MGLGRATGRRRVRVIFVWVSHPSSMGGFLSCQTLNSASDEMSAAGVITMGTRHEIGRGPQSEKGAFPASAGQIDAAASRYAIFRACPAGFSRP